MKNSKQKYPSCTTGYRKLFTPILLSLFVLLSSCNKALPAGFWANFHKDLIIKDINDQGPNGGHRALFWKAKKQNTFTSKEILSFALNNGWKFKGTLSIKSEDLKRWNYYGSPIFPFSNNGFTSSPSNNSSYSDFPRLINSDLTVFKFDTDWVTIDPGTDNSITENGFILLNKSGTAMSIYHLWGE
ncbi:hypothetical protein [Mucilaginibacter lappiensis]|uniref:hypothetical protein n=1 Tax=Mucilaginibacter lappiensis TaxID=354630 RepID=UPI003D246648